MFAIFRISDLDIGIAQSRPSFKSFLTSLFYVPLHCPLSRRGWCPLKYDGVTLRCSIVHGFCYTLGTFTIVESLPHIFDDLKGGCAIRTYDPVFYFRIIVDKFDCFKNSNQLRCWRSVRQFVQSLLSKFWYEERRG